MIMAQLVRRDWRVHGVGLRNYVKLNLFETVRSFHRTQSSKAYSLHDPRRQQTQPNSKQSPDIPDEVQVACKREPALYCTTKEKKVVWPPFWAVKTIFFSAHYLLCKRPS